MFVSANITKQSITKEQKLNVIIEFLPETIDEKEGLSEAVCGVDIIQFDKHIYINPALYYSQIVDQREKAINIDIDVSSLSPGVYCFYNLSIHKSDIKGNEIEGYSIEYPDLLFEIREDMFSYEKNHYQLIEERDQLISSYNIMYNSGIGVERTNETIEYECYLFCSDIYIGKEMLLGKCNISPYKSIDNRNIYDYIKDFVQSIGLVPLPDRAQVVDDYNPYAQPCAVIHFPVVIAHNPQEAGNIAHEKAKFIINAFSVTNDSYGTIIGDLVLDKINNRKYHRCMVSSYMGNLFVGMENPKKLYNLVEYSESDSLKNFYLELFLECSREKRSKYAYFRFWSLLETIGRNKDYISKPKKDIYGNVILNKKLLPVMTQDNAYEIVFELIRHSYEKVGKLPIEKSNNLLQSDIADRITIWYQRRNCIAHRGGCLHYDINICDQSNIKKSKCFQALNEMGNKAQSIDGVVDEYLFDLKNIAREILLIELDCQ